MGPVRLIVKPMCEGQISYTEFYHKAW